MKGKQAVFIAVAFAVGIAAIVLWTLANPANYTYQGTEINPPAQAYDFSLVKADGTTFRLSDQHGKIVLLYFGFTHCPDVCPTSLVDVKRAFAKLGDLAEEVVFVFITVDPERDTAEKMAEYASAFHPDFVALSGTEEELMPIYESYGVYREKEQVKSEVDYLYAHTAIVYVIDRAGNWRMSFPFGMGSEPMAEDLSHLIKE
jgi:protein SCO1/2